MLCWRGVELSNTEHKAIKINLAIYVVFLHNSRIYLFCLHNLKRYIFSALYQCVIHNDVEYIVKAKEINLRKGEKEKDGITLKDKINRWRKIRRGRKNDRQKSS